MARLPCVFAPALFSCSSWFYRERCHAKYPVFVIIFVVVNSLHQTTNPRRRKKFTWNLGFRIIDFSATNFYSRMIATCVMNEIRLSGNRFSFFSSFLFNNLLEEAASATLDFLRILTIIVFVYFVNC